MFCCTFSKIQFQLFTDKCRRFFIFKVFFAKISQLLSKLKKNKVSRQEKNQKASSMSSRRLTQVFSTLSSRIQTRNMFCKTLPRGMFLKAAPTTHNTDVPLINQVSFWWTCRKRIEELCFCCFPTDFQMVSTWGQKVTTPCPTALKGMMYWLIGTGLF